MDISLFVGCKSDKALHYISTIKNHILRLTFYSGHLLHFPGLTNFSELFTFLAYQASSAAMPRIIFFSQPDLSGARRNLYQQDRWGVFIGSIFSCELKLTIWDALSYFSFPVIIKDIFWTITANFLKDVHVFLCTSGVKCAEYLWQ